MLRSAVDRTATPLTSPLASTPSLGALACATSSRSDPQKTKGIALRARHAELEPPGLATEDAFFVVQDGKIVDSSIASVIPKVQDDRLALVAFSGVEQFRPLFDGLTGVEVFSPSPDAMRLPQTPDPGDTLHRDASNIASVIGRIGSESPGTKARIEEYLRAIVPGIHSVKREAAGAWETLTFQQEVKGAVHAWQFPATSVSDGTLRALAVLTAMLDTSGASPSPIAVEEPETALHPAAAGGRRSDTRRVGIAPNTRYQSQP